MSNKINILLSYPRSGNTWVRYFVECVSKKPTVMMPAKRAMDPTIIKTGAVGGSVDLGVDLTAPAILIKRHDVDDEADRVIFLLRNYRECVLRNMVPCSVTRLHNGTKHYSRCLKFFDEFKGDKLLIYYEDLILTPKRELAKVARFLNLNNYFGFFKNLNEHRKNSLRTYPGKSQTGGTANFNYHAKRYNSNFVNIIEKNIREDAVLYKKYLTRYERT